MVRTMTNAPINANQTLPSTPAPSAPILRWTIHPTGKQPAYQDASVVHPDGSIGKVVSGQSSVTFGGKPASCIGDKVECPGHTGVIIAGAKSVSIGGKALAREGDKTSCGGVIMNGFPTITVQDLTKTVHGKSGDSTEWDVTLSLLESLHAQQGSYAGMVYTIKLDGQEKGEGIIDEVGQLHFEMEESTQSVEVLLANGEHFQFEVVDNLETESQRLANQGFIDSEHNPAKTYFDLVHQKE